MKRAVQHSLAASEQKCLDNPDNDAEEAAKYDQFPLILFEDRVKDPFKLFWWQAADIFSECLLQREGFRLRKINEEMSRHSDILSALPGSSPQLTA